VKKDKILILILIVVAIISVLVVTVNGNKNNKKSLNECISNCEYDKGHAFMHNASKEARFSGMDCKKACDILNNRW